MYVSSHVSPVGGVLVQLLLTPEHRCDLFFEVEKLQFFWNLVPKELEAGCLILLIF